MLQIIEVRFLNPETGQVFHKSFTSASSHQRAIELALFDFSDGQGQIKSLSRDPDVEQGKRADALGASAYRYLYQIVIEDPDEGPEGPGRFCYALLFTTYREKEDKEYQQESTYHERVVMSKRSYTSAEGASTITTCVTGYCSMACWQKHSSTLLA